MSAQPCTRTATNECWEGVGLRRCLRSDVTYTGALGPNLDLSAFSPLVNSAFLSCDFIYGRPLSLKFVCTAALLHPFQMRLAFRLLLGEQEDRRQCYNRCRL